MEGQGLPRPKEAQHHVTQPRARRPATVWCGSQPKERHALGCQPLLRPGLRGGVGWGVVACAVVCMKRVQAQGEGVRQMLVEPLG